MLILFLLSVYQNIVLWVLFHIHICIIIILTIPTPSLVYVDNDDRQIVNVYHQDPDISVIISRINVVMENGLNRNI